MVAPFTRKFHARFSVARKFRRNSSRYRVAQPVCSMSGDEYDIAKRIRARNKTPDSETKRGSEQRGLSANSRWVSTWNQGTDQESV